MDCQKGLCYKVKPDIELFKINLGSALNEISQNAKNLNGKTPAEKRLIYLREFSNLSISHRVIYSNHMWKYKEIKENPGFELGEDFEPLSYL